MTGARSDPLGPVTIVRAPGRDALRAARRSARSAPAARGGRLVLGLLDTPRPPAAGRPPGAATGETLLLTPADPDETRRGSGPEPPSRVALVIPRWMLNARLPAGAPPDTTRIPGDAGAGSVLSAQIGAVAAAVDTIDPSTACALAHGVVDTLALALRRPDAGRAGAPRERLLHAALALIDARLASPDLTPASVAARLSVSVRRLHALFAEQGTTFGAWVRDRRLARCRRDLADPGWAHVAIGEIALRWGFRDPSHFGRAFRARYGVTPSAFRAGALPPR